MTDYTHGTGNSGTMMIRDVGDNWVEFWLRSNSSTFAYQMPWASIVNGSQSAWHEFRFEIGGNWQKIGWFYITTSQTVTFKLGATGTNSLGGPTDFSQYIDRAVAPSPPNITSIYNIWSDRVDLAVTNNSDGGAAIQDHQIGYGLDPWTIQYLSATFGTAGSTRIDGLIPGRVYYFWARAWNVKGWSGWSGRAQATTLRVPDAPTIPTASNIKPTSMTVSWNSNGNGGSAFTNYELAWAWGTPAGGAFVGTNQPSPVALGGLTPGLVYYLWARSQNAVGWGPYAGPSIGYRTIAGAYIPVGAEQKLAVPYVRVGGVWKLAEPWVRIGGVWKQTI